MALPIAAVLSGSEVDPCCCGDECNVIPQSLCGAVDNACAWYTEFTDPSAEPPVEVSCPPKFYKKITRTITWAVSATYSSSFSFVEDGITYSGSTNIEASVSGEFISEETKTKNEEGVCVYSYNCISGNISSVRITDITENFGGSTYSSHTDWREDYSLLPQEYANLCIFEGIVNESGWEDYGGGRIDWSNPPYTDPTRPQFFSFTDFYGGDGTGYDYFTIGFPDGSYVSLGTPTIVVTPTTRTVTYPATHGGTAAGTCTMVAELSEEVDLYDALAENVCDTEPCLSTDDPLDGCELCCTDRGGPVSGERYLDEPEGCITPGTSATAWDSSPCDTSGDRSGQAVDLALWFKDLVPDTTYTVTITYKRCPFAEDEEGDPIPPTCSGPNSCEGGEESWETITDEIVFVAEHWGEILAINCGLCAVLRKQCELEDEANEWNIAHPEDPPRSVACTGGGLRVPTAAGKYTWFDSCTYVAEEV